jgi:hypothetical protein
VNAQLEDTRKRLTTGHQFFMPALEVVQDPQACYRRANGDLRRAMNKPIFIKPYVDDTAISGDQLAPGLQEIIQTGGTTPATSHSRRCLMGPGERQTAPPGRPKRRWTR